MLNPLRSEGEAFSFFLRALAVIVGLTAVGLAVQALI